MNAMPRIDLTALKASGKFTDAELELVAGIVAGKGKNEGLLRASKPKIEYVLEDQYYKGVKLSPLRRPTAPSGYVAYLWRMVAFFISPVPQHQCMPCLAFCDLPEQNDERRAKEKELDALADRIVDTFPKEQWKGVIRWGQALGQIGTPQAAPDGSIIYR